MQQFHVVKGPRITPFHVVHSCFTPITGSVNILFMHNSNPASKYNFPPLIISIVASYCHMRLGRILYCCVAPFPPPRCFRCSRMATLTFPV